MSRCISALAVIYWLAILVFAGLLWTIGDVVWLGTLMLFGPRWLISLPLLFIVPAVIFTRHWPTLILCVMTVLIIVWSILGITLNPSTLLQSSAGNLRVLTCNNDSKALQIPAFKYVLSLYQPDVVLLQEANPQLSQNHFPEQWYWLEAPCNLRLASRYPARLLDVRSLQPETGQYRGAAKFVVDSPDGSFIIFNIHMPTPRDGLEAVLTRSPDAIDVVRDMIEMRSEASDIIYSWVGFSTQPTLLAGDFNMPIESRIYRRDWSDYYNAFSRRGNGWGQTMFTRFASVRIDHILYNEDWNCTGAWVGPDVGSAHRPVIADFRLRN